MLKPQDVLVACKLLTVGPEWTYARLAGALALSTAEAHASVRRLGEAGVLRAPSGGGARLYHRDIFELLLAAPRIFYAEQTPRSGRGTPTSTWAPCLAGQFESDPQGEPVVWASPYPEAEEPGQVSGRVIKPLYPTVPRAVRGDADLWRLLALVDVVRVEEQRHARRAASLLRQYVVEDRT